MRHPRGERVTAERRAELQRLQIRWELAWNRGEQHEANRIARVAETLRAIWWM